MNRRLVFALLVVLLGFCVAHYRWAISQSLTETEVVFEVRSGDSLARVASRLSEIGLLDNTYWFKASAVWSGAASRLKAGEYVISPGVTVPELLELLVSGAVRQHSLLLVEGWNYRQVMNAVCSHPVIVKTVCGRSEFAVAEVFGSVEQHPEGRFFPDTYHLTRGTPDIDFLKRAVVRMDRVLQSEWDVRSENLPFEMPYEALILASIIEKETGRTSERREISGVFVRRLQKRMLLQADPTVIYGMGEHYKGNIRSRDLVEDTPYNTYVHPGLPPTPIAIPGRASIHAALHPKEDSTLFFVAKGDGSHYFSSSRREHNRAVNRYQRKRKH